MKNLTITAVAVLLALAGAQTASGSYQSANLEYFHEYEAMFLAHCTKSRGASVCQRMMEEIQAKLRAEDFALLASDARLLEIVSLVK